MPNETMHRTKIVMVALFLMGCATAPVSKTAPEPPCEVTEEVMSRVSYVEGRDPCAKYAISIVGATCTHVGIEAEHRWLAEHYPGYVVTSHALDSNVVGSSCPFSPYSVFTILLPSNETKAVTFEISEFYAK
jgi:seryl-tRNA(Sec) selenium transferase